MKKFVLAVVFALMASVAMAGTYSLQACTTDHKAATLTLDIADGSSKEIVEGIRVAFTKAANGLTAEELVSAEGFTAFVNNMTEEQYDAISLNSPPSITTTAACSK